MIIVSIALGFMVGAAAAATSVYTSLPYRSRADSPFFAGILSGETLVEDFEDGESNTPGMTIRTVRGGVSNPYRWSVDADDGVLDNIGTGYSWVTPGGTLPDNSGDTVEISFAPDAEGNYPSHAGLVILGYTTVDLGFFRRFMAFDNQGQLIPESLVTANVPIYQNIGGEWATQGDRFFGLSHQGGISKIFANDVHFDHIQSGYGPIPEPGSAGLAAAALAGLGWTRRRRLL